MNAERILENDWKILEEHRQKIARQITSLQLRFNNLSEEPEMKPLLKKRDQLKKAVSGLSRRISSRKKAISTMEGLLQERKNALVDIKSERLCESQLGKRKHCLERLKRDRAEKEQIEKQEMFIWE